MRNWRYVTGTFQVERYVSTTDPGARMILGLKGLPLHQDTPRAYPKIKGAACPAGTFSSGDYCKAFR